jgi:hypothetical protein
MKKTTILGGVTAALFVGTVAVITQNPSVEKIELKDPQVIEWEKPTTDKEWAEDVKKENFDIKTDTELTEMIESHAPKLSREEKELKKYQQCPECAYWEARDLLEQSYPDMSEAELHAEAAKTGGDTINNLTYEVEKLKQSIERMNKELELRKKGFVELKDGKRKVN